MLEKYPDKQSFTTGLNNQGIAVVYRTNEQGIMYGITFVDNKNKTVFNGSELGKQYGAAAIQQRLLSQPELLAKRRADGKESQPAVLKQDHLKIISQQPTGKIDLLKTIIESSDQYNYLPYELKKKRKRKKRKLGL